MGHHPKTRAERRYQRDRVVANRMKVVQYREQPRQWNAFKHRFLQRQVKPWYGDPGKFHKHRPYACSNPRCFCCGFSKLFYPKERRLRLKEELRRYLDGQIDL